MKKILSLVLALLMLLSLVSCGQSEPIICVKSGAYNLTPQEYIDFLNGIVDAQNDSRYVSVPAFEESGTPIAIDYIYFNLTLTTNDDGYITKIYYDWDSGYENIIKNVGLLVGATIGAISPDNGENVLSELDMMDTATNSYETSCLDNGTQYNYRAIGNGKFNYLTITPEGYVE